MKVDLDGASVSLAAYEARRELLDETGSRATELMRANAPEDSGELKRKHRWEGPDAEAEGGIITFHTGYEVPLHEGWERYEYGRDSSGAGQGGLVASFRGDPWARRTLDEMSAGLG